MPRVAMCCVRIHTLSYKILRARRRRKDEEEDGVEKGEKDVEEDANFGYHNELHYVSSYRKLLWEEVDTRPSPTRWTWR